MSALSNNSFEFEYSRVTNTRGRTCLNGERLTTIRFETFIVWFVSEAFIFVTAEISLEQCNEVKTP